MENKISIRKAEINDVSKIKEFSFSSLNEYEIAIPNNYSVSDIDSTNAMIKNDPKFVLLRDNTIIGFLFLKPLSEDSIELKRLYLASTVRGQGFGDFLLNYAINFAIENNYKYIRLETTSKFKEAVSQYKKYGFNELEGIERAFGHDLAFEKRLSF